MINPATLSATVILAILTIALPRKYFLIPYVLAVCFIPAEQRIIIMSLDFTVLRILVIAGVVRILLRDEWEVIEWNKFDKLLLGWAFCGAIIYVTQWHNMRAVIFKSGALFDIIGLYWLFRQSIRSWNELRFVMKVFAICALLLMPLVAMRMMGVPTPHSSGFPYS